MCCPPPDALGDDAGGMLPPRERAARGAREDESASADDAPARRRYTRDDPLTFIVPEPLLLRLERIERDGASPDDQPVAFTRAGPGQSLLAMNAYPKPLVDAFLASDAFGEPVIIVGAAWEEEGGIRGELSALLPERTLRAIQDAVRPEDENPEPWAASTAALESPIEEMSGATDFRSEESSRDPQEDGDDEDADAESGEPHFPLVIGAVLRFPENRRFPGDFELEVDDLMRAILEGRAVDAAEKRIDNLLGDL